MEQSLEELRKEATLRVLESDGAEPQKRTCWVCDPLKEFLKRREEVFQCINCQHVYYKGVDITLPLVAEELENENTDRN